MSAPTRTLQMQGAEAVTEPTCPNLWLKGPEWLADSESWPAGILTEPSKETEADAKLTKDVLGTIVETKDDLDETLNKHSF